jgi:hypothetical protein
MGHYFYSLTYTLLAFFPEKSYNQEQKGSPMSELSLTVLRRTIYSIPGKEVGGDLNHPFLTGRLFLITGEGPRGLSCVRIDINDADNAEFFAITTKEYWFNPDLLDNEAFFIQLVHPRRRYNCDDCRIDSYIHAVSVRIGERLAKLGEDALARASEHIFRYGKDCSASNLLCKPCAQHLYAALRISECITKTP